MKRVNPIMPLIFCAVVALGTALLPSAGAKALIRSINGKSHDWPTYGGTVDNQRYSTLAQINRANAGRLQVAWTFQSGFATPQTSFECTPIVIDGIMYVTSPKDDVFALKADTGEIIWQYDPKVDFQRVKLCCGIINRGVAVSEGRVYVATLDARLVALDARTGRPVESFGEGGEVRIADHSKGYSETAAPVIHGNKVLLGVAGGEFQTRGFFSAYDAKTGKMLWRWHTIPAPNEPGGDSWPNNGAYQAGGVTAWMTAAVDVENNQVIFGTGNPNPDFKGGARPGDNLYGCSIVALDVDTGKLRWYFQQVKHDLWDYDQSSPPILFDSLMGGKRVGAVGAAGKIGWFYILDRKTGRSLLPTREIAVPQDAAQATSATQVVLAVPPFVAHKNIFTPPTKKGVVIAPGLSGGSEWSPLAYSPQTGLAYIAAVDKPMTYVLDGLNPFPDLNLGGIAFVPDGKEVEPRGAFVAIDVNTGLVRWRTPTRPHPVGGLLATAGGLVFAGESNGWFDAMDAATGRILWRFQCGAGVNAAPMTYSVGGRQYVAVAAGGLAMESLTSGQAGLDNFRRGTALLVFALPGPDPQPLKRRPTKSAR
ncbi:MAG TPA: PQQ-binding-like beta-propeller repeat protein [Blastocatellia bacterium]|nr:PQQ-binding-like beta-propeller repeat protein [Blastocatellia bacterium]